MEDEIKTVEITDADIENFVLYQRMDFHRTPEGVDIGISQIPVPKTLLENFQAQFGEEMAKENLKIVIYKGKAFLSPVQTTSLIGFKS